MPGVAHHHLGQEAVVRRVQLVPLMRCCRQHSVDAATAGEEAECLLVLVVVPGLLGPPLFS